MATLGDGPALEALVDGADAVVHAAGVVRASDAATFVVGQCPRLRPDRRRGVAAGTAAGSCRCPPSRRGRRVSPYAASKAQGEAEALRHADACRSSSCGRRRSTALETGRHCRSARPRRGWLVHPRGIGTRFSLLYVEDLPHLLCALLAGPPRSGTILEPDDGRAGGYGWAELATVAERQLGRSVRRRRATGRRLPWRRGWPNHGRSVARPPILSRGKIAELYHRDWVCERRGMAAVPDGGRESASATA